MRFLTLILLIPAPAWARFERPIPQVQSATAEFWFALATLALLIALVAVHVMVTRR